MRRRVLYLTGTRADFGLMLPTLRAIDRHPLLELTLLVTGMHLSPRFGYTLREVEASGLRIRAQLPAEVEDDSGPGMARAAAQVATGTAALFSAERPDLCLLLGDRWEMLATATSALLCGMPIVHVCGGERSGSVDDSIRHAISKMAHVHAVSTEGARERLRRMGEDDSRIHVVGAPGLVGLARLATIPRHDWARTYGLDPGRPIAAVLFHPVVQDAAQAGGQMRALLNAVMDAGLQALCLMPNADAGSALIRGAIQSAQARTPTRVRTVTHLAREAYVSLLQGADLLVGNSSSGIVEAATFGTPVVNVGDRQADRERNANTLDCPAEADAIRRAIDRALALPRTAGCNIYGDGQTDRKVAELLSSLPPTEHLLKKSMTY